MLASVGVQAAAFRRPSPDDLVAVKALHALLDYRVMRATEDIGNRTSPAICLQGWFHSPRHRAPVRGALVLLGNGERLYDFGSGIRRFGDARRVEGVDRIRFILAGCPRVIAAEIGHRLVHSLRVDVDPGRADGLAVDSIGFGSRSKPIDLYVTRHTYAPVELALASNVVRGSSRLDPGGNRALVQRVRRAFHLGTKSVRRA